MKSTRFTDPDVLAKKIKHVDDSAVDGSLFLEVLICGLRLKTAAALSRATGVPPPVLSRIRSVDNAVPDNLLLALHEQFGFEITDLKSLLLECTRKPGKDQVDAELSWRRVTDLANRPMFAKFKPVQRVAPDATAVNGHYHAIAA